MPHRKNGPAYELEPSRDLAVPFLYLPNGQVHAIRPNGRDPKENWSDGSSFRRETEYGNLVDARPIHEIKTDFEALPDGSLIDLVRNPKNPDRPSFLVWKDLKATIASHVDYDGRRFIPPRVDSSVIRSVGLPTGIATCPTAKELLEELAAAFSPYIYLSSKSLFLVCAFVLGTWFVDLFSIAPYLVLVGPLGMEKTSLLRLLHCVCRRGFFLGNTDLVSLCQVRSTIKPTLLIHAEGLGNTTRSRNLLGHLQAGSRKGAHVLRQGKVFESFGAGAITMRFLNRDVALAGPVIPIALSPSPHGLLRLDDASMERIAGDFQAKLLMYRLQHYRSVRDSCTLEVPRFTSGLRDVVPVLAAPMLGDSVLVEKLVVILGEEDHETRLDRQLELEWLVVEALLYFYHRQGGMSLLVGKISIRVERLLATYDVSQEIRPRAVGAILRTLGFRTERLGNSGRGIHLTGNVGLHIHELAQAYGLRLRDTIPSSAAEGAYAGEPCVMCRSQGLDTKKDGAPLRYVDLERRTELSKVRLRPYVPGLET